jgi:glycosyltransferase involved in cell wall biosynthesis
MATPPRASPTATAAPRGAPMRIAYVIPAYPPVASQPFVVNEMVEVQDAGHTLIVVPLYPGPSTGIQHGTFARLRPAAVLPPALLDRQVVGRALRMLARRPLRTLGVVASVCWAARRNPFALVRLLVVTPKALATSWTLGRMRVDRIHAHFATQTADCAAMAGGLAGIPFSFTAHAYDIYSTDRRVRNDTLGWKLARACQVFTVNEYAAGLLRARMPERRRDRVHTAYVGIPMQLFRAEPPPPYAGSVRLLCVARLCEKKGLDTLIEACALLRDRQQRFELRLFGDGPLRAALVAQVARLELAGHVLLGDSISQEDVAREMKACHAFVMPCRRDRSGDMDGIPTVFMEAMATGRPVISCPVSGVPELVRDRETGLLVAPNDARALAAAITTLAEDDALRERLGRAARALVERQHDQRLTAARFLALIDQTLHAAPCAAASGADPTPAATIR